MNHCFILILLLLICCYVMSFFFNNMPSLWAPRSSNETPGVTPGLAPDLASSNASTTAAHADLSNLSTHFSTNSSTSVSPGTTTSVDTASSQSFFSFSAPRPIAEDKQPPLKPTTPVRFCNVCGMQPSDHDSDACTSTANSEPNSPKHQTGPTNVLSILALISPIRAAGPNVYVTRMSTAATLTKAQADVVINVCEVDHTDETKARYATEGIRYHWIPVLDLHSTDLLPLSLEVYDLMLYYTYEKEQNKPQRLVVHCKAGVSRSIAVVLFYAMVEQRQRISQSRVIGQNNGYYSVDEMLALIQQDRALAWPNSGFRKQLQAFFDRCPRLEATGGFIPPDSCVKEQCKENPALNRLIAPKVYLAGRFGAKEGVHRKALLLQKLGFRITHDWTQFEKETPRSDGEDARLDLTGAIQADYVVVLFDSWDYSFRGSFTELGAALACRETCSLLGKDQRPFSTKRIVAMSLYPNGKYKENVFWHHPGVEHVESWAQVLQLLLRLDDSQESTREWR